MSSSLSPTPIIVDPSAIVGIPKLWQTALPDEPPPGVIPDFHGSNPNGTIYIVFGIICLVVNTVIVLVRFYTKAVLTHSMGWDDCTYMYPPYIYIHITPKSYIYSLPEAPPSRTDILYEYIRHVLDEPGKRKTLRAP